LHRVKRWADKQNLASQYGRQGRCPEGVLKIDDGPREAPFNTRCAEANTQNIAARAGLAPHIILAADGLYFTEFVEGVVWQRSCLEEDSNLELIAGALQRLHTLPLTGRSFDAGVAAKRYVERIAGLDADVVRKCTELIARMRLPQNLCCCHNDLVAENLITTPDLKFLDWEYACDNDPFFDIATVVEHHELSDAQVTKLMLTWVATDIVGESTWKSSASCILRCCVCGWVHEPTAIRSNCKKSRRD